MEVKVRKEFQLVPVVGKNPYFWALLIDCIDYVSVVVDFILSLSSGFSGIGSNVIIDGFQTAIALMIFENPEVALLGGGGDVVLTPFIDIMPTFTASVFVLENIR